MTNQERDHGGDLDRAMAMHGGGDWLDLSTGINPVPYPVPPLPDRAWAALPTGSDLTGLEAAAAALYATPGRVVALAGAQAAIQLVPRLSAPGKACIVGPTYNEHAGALRAQGWSVTLVDDPEDCAGADLMTVVNPNNPDGRSWAPERLLALRGKVGRMVVDESFADTEEDLSLAPHITPDEDRITVLRSFGKFFGLAGVRLGFAISGTAQADQLRALAGPWAVGGPAVAIGQAALMDGKWQAATRDRLRRDRDRLDALCARAGWSLIGGTPLFRTYQTPGAEAAQTHLAQQHIWTRIFPYSDSWLRLGLPGSESGWTRLTAAMDGLA